MNKFFKIVFSFVMVIVFCFGLVACKSDYYPEYESGYFKYAVKTEKDGTQKAYILGLTESGLEQAALVYPEEIEGIPVYGIGYDRLMGIGHEAVGAFRSENLQKFYFPYMPKERTVSNVGISFYNGRIVYWNLCEDNLSNRVYGGNAGAIFGYNYIENECWVKDYLPRFIGNISYLYNYSGAPNEGYYWVDSYDESVITFIPPEPQREGFSFEGWYKETECINKWNFSTDITGKEIVLESNKTYDTYEGIYLYAKWIAE